MHIRTATLHDAEAVHSIIEAVYIGGGFADPESSPAYVQQLLDARSRIEAAHVFVADVDGVSVGTITAASAGTPYANLAKARELEIRMLGVLPALRNRGIATALIRQCETLAQAAGANRVVLSTDPAMRAAQALYESLDYHRTPERDWEIDGTLLRTYARDL